jgi:hypothetical protein
MAAADVTSLVGIVVPIANLLNLNKICDVRSPDAIAGAGI